MTHPGLHPRIATAVLSLLLLSLAVFQASCGSVEIKSHWRDRTVLADGKNTEWNGVLTQLNDKGTSLGVMNDESFLFVALVTTNHDLQRQIMRQGITFWFDRDGGKDRKFGIRYPLGWGAPDGQRPGGMDAGTGQEMRRGVPDAGEELEIEGPGEEDHAQMTKAQTGGIEAKFALTNDTLVYELKVPLRDNGHHPFALETKPGAKIGAGLETTAGGRPPQAPGESDESSGGRRGGGMGGRGMGRGGGRSGGEGGGERPGRAPRVEPFSAWAIVQLADSTSATEMASPGQPR